MPNQQSAILEEEDEAVDSFDIQEESDEPKPESNYSGPQMTDPEWTNYVLSMLRPEEMYEGYPKVDGLRRVASLLLGPIMDNDTQVVVAPSQENPNRCTAISKVVYLWEFPDGREGQLVRFTGTADVSPNNSGKYAESAASTAESKSESRAHRKALMLIGVYAAEEMMGDKQEEKTAELTENPSGVQDSQIQIINLLSNRLNIDVMKMVNSGEKKFENLNQLSFDEAVHFVKLLNRYQHDTNSPDALPIPDTIKKG